MSTNDEIRRAWTIIGDTFLQPKNPGKIRIGIGMGLICITRWLPKLFLLQKLFILNIFFFFFLIMQQVIPFTQKINLKLKTLIKIEKLNSRNYAMNDTILIK